LRIFSLWLAFVLALAGQTGLGGTVTGIVRAKGMADGQTMESGGNYESKKFKFVESIDYESMSGFVVYIEGPLAGSKPPEKAVVVEQKDATFTPHILPIMVGTTVEWPNEDPIFHNVFSKSATTNFNLGLYRKGDAAKQVTFDKPGEADVFCSIHSKMSCVILVLENPFFAAADSRGRYAITNVPAGSYNLVAWQERLPSKTVKITVPETGDVNINFTLTPVPN
jgi:plastocyanin